MGVVVVVMMNSGGPGANVFMCLFVSGAEIVFGDESGGVSLLHVPTLIVTPLVSNFTFVSTSVCPPPPRTCVLPVCLWKGSVLGDGLCWGLGVRA